MDDFKVKDYTSTYGLVIICCSFPVGFGVIAFIFKGDLLLAFLITVVIYAIVLTFYIKYLNRKQEEYLISAGQEDVAFLKYGVFKWSEIESIEALSQRLLGGRREYKYIKVQLVDDKFFTVAIENCDYEYDVIAEKLNKIGRLPSSGQLKQKLE